VPPINDKVVVGFKALEARLRGLPVRIRRNALRRGLYRAAVIIRDEARRRAHRRFGFLRRMIRARSGAATAGAEISAHVYIASGRFVASGLTKTGRTKWAMTKGKLSTIKARYVNPRRYAHLVEFGTKHSHRYPFLGPAARSIKQRALDQVAMEIRRELNL
jgi:HK97 gp10 family phage protein